MYEDSKETVSLNSFGQQIPTSGFKSYFGQGGVVHCCLGLNSSVMPVARKHNCLQPVDIPSCCFKLAFTFPLLAIFFTLSPNREPVHRLFSVFCNISFYPHHFSFAYFTAKCNLVLTFLLLKAFVKDQLCLKIKLTFFCLVCQVVDTNVSSGFIKSKQLSQMSTLTSSYDVAWRKHDFAKYVTDVIPYTFSRSWRV